MRVDVAIIGGTGIGDRLLASGGEPMHVPTRAGMLRGRLFELSGKKALLISRHSLGHKFPPHRVNFKAMALGLLELGVDTCLSTAAVGSLRTDWPAGTLVACSDFLDFTGRNLTLRDDEVAHTDFSDPFGQRGRRALLLSARAIGLSVREEGVYLCGNGPRYETPTEIQLYRKLGADVVGMTAASEAVLMREAGVDYACLAIVTNLAAGISATPLSHAEVVEEMVRSGENAIRILTGAVAELCR